jgi:hypothetical protein
MKESIANSAIFTIMIVFIVTIMLLVISSLNYSKAFKAKNRISDIIEKYDVPFTEENGSKIITEINSTLEKLGYKTNYANDICPYYPVYIDGRGEMTISSMVNSGASSDRQPYLYCIYPVPNNRGTMYHVVAYVFWELPVVGSVAKIKVGGDTVVFYQTIDNHRK